METKLRRRIARVCAGLVLAAIATTAHAGSVHEVMQIGITFEPADIEVEPGDTIRWIHTVGFHTVTSGEPCIFDGQFFDAPLDANNPEFEWIVPDEGVKDLAYFCRPHCGVNMVGTITVTAGKPCPGDIDGCGNVDFNDILLILSAWGCKGDCPEDVDNSGVVDFGDILVVLAGWGPCP